MKARHILYCCVLGFLLSCSKGGPGGEAGIRGIVKHHSAPIPAAVVYIKYDAKEFPGADLSLYDASVTTSNPEARFEFNGLKRGYYYLYAVGYDSSISSPVSGGLAVHIKYMERKVVVEQDVYVLE